MSEAPKSDRGRYAQPGGGDGGVISDDFRISAHASAAWDELKRLGLLGHVAELDALGYTIVPPEKAAPPGFADRVREAILDVAERRWGARPDLDTGANVGDPSVAFGNHVAYLLFEDDVFQQAVCNPVVLALVTYLLGESCVLSNALAFLKGPGEEDLALHCDNAMVPEPFPPVPLVCNATWLLTDYSEADGALCFVPGSHALCRHPKPGEGLTERVAIEAPAGSLAFWHGHTWHGAFRRRTPGARLNLINAFMRQYMLPQEPYRDTVTPEILARNPPRFAKLMGRHVAYGWKEEGPDYGRLGRNRGGRARWD